MEEKMYSGNIKISDEAVANIAAIAAKNVEGVIDLDPGTVGNLAEALGVRHITRGVKVEINGEMVSVDLNIIIAFGREIIETAAEVQEKVLEAIEQMTGLIVEKINVNVNSIRPASDKKRNA
jgi:uncharacterized alkaline shock family protein YloU